MDDNETKERVTTTSVIQDWLMDNRGRFIYRFYVYILYYSDGVTPMYVGKGCDDRWLVHEKICTLPAYIKHNRRLYKNIESIISTGSAVPKSLFIQGLDDKGAQYFERLTIKKIGRKALGTGPLLNLTDGGDGMSGHIHSIETRLKMSKSRKGKVKSPETLQKLSNALKGRKVGGHPGKGVFHHSEESKRKMSESHKGKIIPEETLLKFRARRWTEEQKEERRKSMIGHPTSDETRLKISLAITEVWKKRKSQEIE